MADTATNQATLSNGATAGPSLADLNAAQSQSDQISTIMKRKDFDPGGASAKFHAIVGSYDNPDDQKKALEANGATDVIPFSVQSPGVTPPKPDPTGADMQIDPTTGAVFSPSQMPKSGPTSTTNFIYTDPETKRPTIYNPGFWKDPVGALASLGPEAGEMVGGIAGAIGGEAAMPAGGGFVGAGLGAATGKTAVQSLIHQLAGVDDSRSFGNKVMDFGTTAVMNAVGAKLGELIPSPSGIVRRLIDPQMDPVVPGSSSAESATLRGVPPPENETFARIGAADRQTVNMDNATLYANPSVQQVGAVVQGLGPLSGGIKQDINQSIADGAGAMNRITNQISPNLGRVDSRTVGDAVSDVADTGVQGFDQTRRAVQQQLDQLAPPTTRVAAPNTQQFLANRLAENQAYPGLQTENAQAVAAANRLQQSMRNGTLSLQELKSNRQAIGAQAFGEAPAPGQLVARPDQKLQGLYEAVRQDYLQGTQSVSPQAGRLAQNLDQYISQMRGPDNPIHGIAGTNMQQMPIQDLGKLVNDAPDSLANQIVRGQVQAGRTLQQIRNTLFAANQTAQGRAAAQDAWNRLQASVWRRMASADPSATGASSANDMSFLKLHSNWHRMDDTAQAMLMDGLPNDIRANMHDMLTLADGAAQSAKHVNWSHSGDVVNLGALANTVGKPVMNAISQLFARLGPAGGGTAAGFHLAGPIGALAGGAAGAVAPGQIYRLLGNPAFRRWLSTAARTQMNAPLPLKRLATMAASNYVTPQVRGLMQQYLAQMGYQGQ